MTLPIAAATDILHAKFGAPVKAATQYVVGFQTSNGKLLALDRQPTESRIWFQAPAPPPLAGVTLIDYAKNSNLNGPLLPLSAPGTLRVQLESGAALQRFIDWYAGPVTFSGAPDVSPSILAFEGALQRFRTLIATNDGGHPFNSFTTGLVAVEEGYKLRLRDHAREILGVETWTEAQIGSGTILDRTIRAIEISEKSINIRNNLVMWENRYGHSNRDHSSLLEAQKTPKSLKKLEHLIFNIFRNIGDEASNFDVMSDLAGKKYNLLAYLFFLKDAERFMPIRTRSFDRAFTELGVPVRTVGNCSWENYVRYNGAIAAIREKLATALSPMPVRLIDAHTFCWILATMGSEPEASSVKSISGAGRILDDWQQAIVEMRMSVENTVRNANGQIVEQTLKNKDLLMTPLQLEQKLSDLLEIQQRRCALTGISFDVSRGGDKNLRPSLDRIDSDGHYAEGNLQVVCRFINFWKGAVHNEEFKRLLMLVRGLEAG